VQLGGKMTAAVRRERILHPAALYRAVLGAQRNRRYGGKKAAECLWPYSSARPALRKPAITASRVSGVPQAGALAQTVAIVISGNELSRRGDCGRDAHYWAPPAQNRTCGIVG
jgi:hypothetical protein